VLRLPEDAKETDGIGVGEVKEQKWGAFSFMFMGLA
jgi:hypothetical protein